MKYNLSAYVFGEFASGYSQYPDDYSSQIFKEFYRNSKATTQIAIHRDGNMMYYGYIRKLDQQKYIGFCVVLNGIMLRKLDGLFSLFENTVSRLAESGSFVHFDDNGALTTSTSQLYLEKDDLDLLKESLGKGFNRLEEYASDLPVANFGVSNDSVKEYSIDDEESDIVRASHTYGYTYIYKSRDYNTAAINSYSSKLKSLNEILQERSAECAELKKQVGVLSRKQRNVTWVSIMTIVALVLFGVIWVKVINPNEVTNYYTKDYMYYGPMKNKMPNGRGVAIYHNDDKDGRMYYIGNFEDGKRKDDDAIMFYKDGSYFRGAMDDDVWKEGLMYNKSDMQHFIGSFRDNIPYDGVWYKHEKAQTIHEMEE